MYIAECRQALDRRVYPTVELNVRRAETSMLVARNCGGGSVAFVTFRALLRGVHILLCQDGHTAQREYKRQAEQGMNVDLFHRADASQTSQ
jgi:hypothetical protein